MTGQSTVIAALEAATQLVPEGASAVPARFALIPRPDQDPIEVAAEVVAALRPWRVRVGPLSTLDPSVLVLELRGRIFVGDQAACFSAAYELTDAFDLEAAEPDLPLGISPDGNAPEGADSESTDGGPPLCFVPEDARADAERDWALRIMRIREAWAYSEQQQRPSRGAGIVVAQPDTGITNHPELRGISRAPGRDVLDDRADPTDPMNYLGFKGHGTGTASVLVSPDTLTVVGAAPSSRHMAIRAIETVIRIRQVTVARAIDWAVDHGAQVITMSLGGIPSFALARAVSRAVQADVLVLAAAGNCVGAVVWPARYDECIAVAATDLDDGKWRGSSHGSAVDVSAPGENVIRAMAGTDQSGQGQGTSFAVALTAGVAALWLAHHGRANLVAAARQRGETLQTMFRRLLRASARRPADWDSFELGAGIVDGEALLMADFDLGRDRESVEVPTDPQALNVRSIKALVTETAGFEASRDEAVDWYRQGPEIAAILLRRESLTRTTPPHTDDEANEIPGTPPPPSDELRRRAGTPELRIALGLDPLPRTEIFLEGGRR